MKQFYEQNTRFKRYVDRYSTQRSISVEESFSHALVREAYEYYRTDKEN